MRATAQDAARRAFVAASRATVRKVNDKPLLQENDIDITHGESRSGNERFQQYGFTAVPLPEDKKTGKAAEAVLLHLGGNRTHAVIIAVDDRRYRLKTLKDGEVAIYDDQGQQVHISRDGIVTSVPAGKKIVAQVVGKAEANKQGEYGTKPQAERTATSSVTLTEKTIDFKTETFTVDAKTIKLNGTDLVSLVSSAQIETVGPTHLGLDATGEVPPVKVVTEGGPAKKTKAKPE